MRSCIVCGSSQHKRQQIKPSAEGGLRQNQDEEDDTEVSLNNDDSVENLNDATAPLVSPFPMHDFSKFFVYGWCRWKRGKNKEEKTLGRRIRDVNR